MIASIDPSDRHVRFPVITPGEASHAPLVRAIRLRCLALTRRHDLKPGRWHGFLIDLLRELDTDFVDSFGRVRQIDTGVFEASDAEIDAGKAVEIAERNREWFKHVACQPLDTDAALFVTQPWHARFRVLGSIVGAAAPEISVGWPRLRSPAADAFAVRRPVSMIPQARDSRVRRAPVRPHGASTGRISARRPIA